MGTVSHSLLSRPISISPSPPLSSLQAQVDGLVGSFTQHATDWRSLAALTAGGMAYRVGRIGAMGIASSNGVRVASVCLGLTAEVSTFEMTHRGLTTLSPTNLGESNLWRWNGSGGLRQGLLQSLITFGAMKGAGRIARGDNVVVQHLFQDSAMVVGHHVSGVLDASLRPTGTLAEQFLHAEATVLQVGAGLALAHRFSPGIQALERGLDLSLRSTDRGANDRTLTLSNLLPQPAFARAVSEGLDRPRALEEILNGPQILQMSRLEKADFIPDEIDFHTLSEMAETDTAVVEYLKTLAEIGYDNAIWALGAAANRNPNAVFALHELAQKGEAFAIQHMRSLDISVLAQLAKSDGDAVWALRYLVEADNHQAAEAMGGLNPSPKNFSIPIEPLLFPSHRRLLLSAKHLKEIGEEAETDPKLVTFLKKLSDEGDLRAQDILLNLNVGPLIRKAENNMAAAYALCELAYVGNSSALDFLKVMDVHFLHQDTSQKAFTTLAFAALAGNPDAIVLWDLAVKKKRGEPSD